MKVIDNKCGVLLMTCTSRFYVRLLFMRNTKFKFHQNISVTRCSYVLVETKLKFVQ